jgi:hypothetical protein
MIITATYTDETRDIKYNVDDGVTVEYDELTRRIVWSAGQGGDMLVFNPNEIPELALSALLFDARKKFRLVGLVDDLVADNDYEHILKNHGFINVRTDGQLGMVLGFCNSSTPPLSQR